MARRKPPPPAAAPDPVEAAVASAVTAHPRADELSALAAEFAAWASERQGAPMRAEQAGQALEALRSKLDSELERARRDARIFTPTGHLRPARYRHGSQFCPSCARYKDFRKECPICHAVEWTW